MTPHSADRGAARSHRFTTSATASHVVPSNGITRLHVTRIRVGEHTLDVLVDDNDVVVVDGAERLDVILPPTAHLTDLSDPNP